MSNDETKTSCSASRTFPRSYRLSGKVAFTKVYDAKTKESRGPLAVYSLPNELNHPRLGVSVSRRVGSAPVRNRVKRMLREAFRAHQHDLQRGYDLVVVVRPHAPMKLAEYQKLMAQLMQKSHAAWRRRSPVQSSEQPQMSHPADPAGNP